MFGNLYGTGAADAERDLTRGPRPGARHRRPGRAAGARRRAGSVGDFRAAAVVRRARAAAAGPQRRYAKQAMQRRLQTARDEVAAFTEYDYVVVNDELDSCVDRMRAIVLAERARLRCAQGTGRTDRRDVYDS